MAEIASYCAQLLRRQDADRYLTALFAPADRREDLFALYAFNLEVARAREVVSEPFMGLIRLQWWRDAIAEIYQGRARAHEVVRPLAAAIAEHSLDRTLFERLIESRERDLDPEPEPSRTCPWAWTSRTESCTPVTAPVWAWSST